MRILVCNDDGVDFPGLKALVNVMKELGEVVVAGPKFHMSGAGSSVSIQKKITVEKFQFDPDVVGYAVYGTPRDCAELGIKALAGGPVDLIITGINEGCNMANNVPSSGTCGAALTGLDFGIPSIATSLDFGDKYDYSVAAKYIQKIAKWFVAQPFCRDFTLSINVPNRPEEEIKGIVVSDNGGIFDFKQDLTPTFDGTYYYYDVSSYEFAYKNKVENLDGDIYALEQGYVVLTPIDLDMVNKKGIQVMKASLNSLK